MLEHKEILMGFLKKNLCSGTGWTLLSLMQVVPFSFKSICTNFLRWTSVYPSSYISFFHISINILDFPRKKYDISMIKSNEVMNLKFLLFIDIRSHTGSVAVSQRTHLGRFAIDSTSKFYEESSPKFHRFWKATPHGNYDMEISTWIRLSKSTKYR